MGRSTPNPSPPPLAARAGLSLAVLACLAAGPARAAVTIRASGTGTAIAALTRLGETFASSQGEVRLTILPSIGSTGAMRAVADGVLDLAVSGRRPEKAETEMGILALEFARTPFAVAVGPRADIIDMGPALLARIYRGEISTWSGGERIRIVMRPRSDVDTRLLRAISPEMSLAVEAAQARPGMLVAATNTECNEMVARTPGAIGPTTLFQVRAEGQTLALLPWNGVPPTVEAMRTGRYPLAKSLYLVVKARPAPSVSRFLEFLASPAAARIISDLGGDPLPFRPPR